MKNFYFFACFLVLQGCGNKARRTFDSESSADTLQIIAPENANSAIRIKDKSNYDPSFIEGLSEYDGPVSLADNYIVTGNDTTWFPEILPLNEVFVFSATDTVCDYTLNVVRTSLTNLNYDFKRFAKGNKKILYQRKGKSVLGSFFFLGAEMDEDSQLGEGYPSSEYWDREAGCWFAIRIGYYKDKNEKYRARLNYGCEDQNQPSLALADCPILRTE